MKKIVTEFKDFISRGNVMDMAVGVIVGGAFGKITSSLVNDVFMPFLGWVIGDIDLTALNITLSPAVMEGETVVKEAVVMGIGSFLATIIDFLLIALVVFLFVKAVNTARSKLEKPAEEEAPAAPPEPSNEEKPLKPQAAIGAPLPGRPFAFGTGRRGGRRRRSRLARAQRARGTRGPQAHARPGRRPGPAAPNLAG